MFGVVKSSVRVRIELEGEVGAETVPVAVFPALVRYSLISKLIEVPSLKTSRFERGDAQLAALPRSRFVFGMAY